MYFKGPIHRRYLGSIRKLKWMTAALSKLPPPSLPPPPSAHPPRASVRFHCSSRTPSQREYKCKSKRLDAMQGSLFIESIIICRRGEERDKELLQGIDLHALVYMLREGGVCTRRRENKTAHTLWHRETCVNEKSWKYRLSLALIQPLTSYSWVVLSVNGVVQFSISLSTWGRIHVL